MTDLRCAVIGFPPAAEPGYARVIERDAALVLVGGAPDVVLGPDVLAHCPVLVDLPGISLRPELVTDLHLTGVNLVLVADDYSRRGAWEQWGRRAGVTVIAVCTAMAMPIPAE